MIHLLCSIEEAEAQFGGVVADLKRVLQGGTGEKLAAPLQRAAVRLLLCMASAAETLDQNILIEFVLLHDLAPALRALVLRGGDAGTDSELREAQRTQRSRPEGHRTRGHPAPQAWPHPTAPWQRRRKGGAKGGAARRPFTTDGGGAHGVCRAAGPC